MFYAAWDTLQGIGLYLVFIHELTKWDIGSALQSIDGRTLFYRVFASGRIVGLHAYELHQWVTYRGQFAEGTVQKRIHFNHLRPYSVYLTYLNRNIDVIFEVIIRRYATEQIVTFSLT